MVLPAAIYAAVVGGGPGASGWGIPMATDIAFAVAVLSLAGACVLVVLGMERGGFHQVGVYAPVAFVFWIAVLESGVHAPLPR